MKKIIVAILIVVGLAYLFWLFNADRYDFLYGEWAFSKAIYKCDKWTGRVYIITPEAEIRIPMK